MTQVTADHSRATGHQGPCSVAPYSGPAVLSAPPRLLEATSGSHGCPVLQVGSQKPYLGAIGLDNSPTKAVHSLMGHTLMGHGTHEDRPPPGTCSLSSLFLFKCVSRTPPPHMHTHNFKPIWMIPPHHNTPPAMILRLHLEKKREQECLLLSCPSLPLA